VLWALSRDLALLSRLKHAESEGGNPGEIMASLRIWQTRQSVIRRAMARYSDAELARLLRFASRVDRTVKGLVQAPAWEAVLELLFESLAPAAYRRLA
jgi:DNA polymerase-3 subunit delta